MSKTKETKMYVIDYTDMDGENLRTILVNATSTTLAWEKVAEYVGLPCKCATIGEVTSGMWLIS